jgi:hypothetical protein
VGLFSDKTPAIKEPGLNVKEKKVDVGERNACMSCHAWQSSSNKLKTYQYDGHDLTACVDFSTCLQRARNSGMYCTYP